MSKSYYHSIAIFIAALMISLPIYAASAHAVITNPQSHGTREINGFFEENDPIHLEVTASIAGDDTITRDQLRFALPNLNVQPQTCSDNGDGTFKCESEIQQNQLGNNPDNVAIPVTLFDNFGNTDDTESLVVTLDNQPPQIIEISSTPLTNGNIRFDYTIKDTANPDTSRCVGFKAIEITGTATTTTTLNINGCDISNFFSLSSSTFTTQTTGIVQVTAVVIDNFDQRSQPVTLNVDVSPNTGSSTIQSATVAFLTNGKITGNDNIEGFVKSDETVTLSIDARIDGDDDIQRTQVELTLLGTQIPIQSCVSQTSGTFRCTHSFSQNEVANLKNFAVPVRLVDDSSNIVANAVVEGSVDEIKPSASNLNIALTTDRKLSIQFTARDTANTQSTLCSGIKNMIVQSAGRSELVDIDIDSCEFSVSRQVDALDILSELRGQSTITVQLFDRLNNIADPVSFVLDLGTGIPVAGATQAILSNQRLRGQKDVTGFIEENDQIQLSVNARIDGPNDDNVVLRNQLQLTLPNGGIVPFQECTDTDGDTVFTCNHILSRSDVDNELEFTLSATLFTDIGERGPSVDFNGIVDNLAPELLSIQTDFTAERKFSFLYNVNERANTLGSTCVGLKAINFSTDTQHKVVPVSVQSCAFSSLALVPGLDLVPLFKGTYAITAVAIDKFDQSSEPFTVSHNFGIGIPIDPTIDAQLINTKVTGQQQILGFVQENELVQLSVVARISDDPTITANQIEVFLPDGSLEPFDNCVPRQNQFFECTKNLDFTKLQGQEVFQIPVSLSTDIGELGPISSLNGTVDKEPPQITTLLVSPTLAGDQDVIISYEVVDTANSATNKCSGPKQLVLSFEAFLKTVDLTASANGCTASGQVTVPSTEISIADEVTATIRARAFDNVNLESSPLTTLLDIDTAEPVFDVNTFAIKTESGADLEFVAESVVQARASVNITDGHFDLTNVRGDFSSLGNNPASLPATCSLSSTIATCFWDISVSVTESGDFPITLSATDSIENTGSLDGSYTLAVDTTAPTLVEFITNHRIAEKNFLGMNNTILATFDEEDSGFDSNLVFLDLTELGLGDNVKTTGCQEQSGDKWICSWSEDQLRLPIRALSATPQQGKKKIIILGTDDVLHPVEGALSQEVIVDVVPPTISSITHTPQTPVSGDTIQVKFNLADNSEAFITDDIGETFTVKARASKISSIEIHEGSCNDDLECTIGINDILSEFIQGSITILATDAAGNTREAPHKVTVYKPEADSIPNFFSVSNIEVVPGRLDRKVARQIPIRVQFFADLRSTGSPTIVSSSLECLDTNLLSGSPYLLNENTKHPIVVLQTSTNIGSFDESVELTCQLTMIVRDEETLFLQPEIENITATIELFGNTLGEIQDNIEKKLEEVNDEISTIEDDIKGIESWLDIFGIYCNLADMMATVNSAIQAIKAAMQPILSAAYVPCAACCFSPSCSPFAVPPACACVVATSASWTGICTASGFMHKLVDGFFWPVGLPIRSFTSPWTIVGWFAKISCMVLYKCALSDWDQLVSVAGEVIRAGIGPKTDINSEAEYNDYTAPEEAPEISGKNGLVESTQKVKVNGKKESVKYIRESKDNWLRAKPNNHGGFEIDPKYSAISYNDASIHLVNAKNAGVPYRPISQSQTASKSTTTETTKSKDKGFFQRVAERQEAKSRKTETASKKATPEGKKVTGRKVGGTIKNIFKQRATEADIYPVLTTDLANQWNNDAESSDIGGFLSDSNRLFDPYASIHYAEASICYPAIVYNKKKERQIKCQYRNCIQNHLGRGEPTTICDFALKERTCLYVESAQYLKDGFEGIFDDLFKALMKYAVFMIVGYVLAEGPCKVYFTPGAEGLCAKPPPLGGYEVLCGLAGAAMAYQELTAVLNSGFGFSDDKTELEGPDFCSGNQDGISA